MLSKCCVFKDCQYMLIGCLYEISNRILALLVMSTYDDADTFNGWGFAQIRFGQVGNGLDLGVPM